VKIAKRVVDATHAGNKDAWVWDGPMPAIDRLEGFYPGGPSLRRRVLEPVCIEHGMALHVRAYVAGESLERSSFRRLEETIWNPGPGK